MTRTTVDFLGGPLYDTALGNIVASGTMVIAGNQITQSFILTVNGTTITLSESATLTDFGAYLVLVTQDGASNRAALIVRGGSLLITEVISPAQDTAPPSAEVDQWALVASGTVSATNVGPAVAKGGQTELDGIAPTLGGAVGSALMRVLPPR